MKTFFWAMATIIILFSSCKKNYSCVCGDWNSSQKTKVFEVKDTKKNAKKKCDDYLKSKIVIPEYTCTIE